MNAVIAYTAFQTTSLVIYLFPPKATDMSYSSHVFGEEKLRLVSNDGDAYGMDYPSVKNICFTYARKWYT
jgi:hypothetical protein